MWFSSVSRRELMDVLITGSVPKISEGQFTKSPEVSKDSFLVVWEKLPNGKVDELPDWIVVKDGSLSEVLALLNSIPQLPQPFTSVCRVMERSRAESMNEDFQISSDPILNGVAGLAMAEATVYAGQGHLVAEVGHSAYRRTLSIVLGRALVAAPPEAYDLVSKNWVQTQTVLGVMPAGFLSISGSLARIFVSASSALIESEPQNFVEKAMLDVIRDGEPSEDTWREITSSWIEAPSLREFGEWTREQRSAGFQEMIKSSRSTKGSFGEEQIAACAIVASRIAPGTFEHLSFLAQLEDSRLALWYGLFAGLQRHGAALRLGGGRGLRILRDMKVRSSSFGPDADISSDELLMFSKIGLEKLSKRLSHSNEIVVELFPGVNASFRFGHRAERAADTKTEGGSTEFARNRVFEALRSLEKTFKELGGEDYKSVHKKPARRRAKPGDLF